MMVNVNDRIVENKVEPNFSVKTIQMAAELGGIGRSIDPEAMNLLCKNLNSRINNVIHCAAQLMHHSKRTRLTTKDISEALHELDCEPILGYNNATSQPEYVTLPSNSHLLRDLYLPRDYYDEVDLKRHSASILLKRFNMQPNIAFNCISKTFLVKFAILSVHCNMIPYQKCFSQITNILSLLNSSKFVGISYHEQHRILHVIRYDLAKNEKIKPILGGIVSFVCNTIQAWFKPNISSEIVTRHCVEFALARYNLTRIYLSIIRAAIMNPLFYELSLETTLINGLSETLLSICFDTDFSGMSHSNFATLYWPLLDLCSSAALLLCQILYKFSFSFTNIQQQILNSLHKRIVSKRCDKQLFENVVSETFLRRNVVDFMILRIYRYLGFKISLCYLNPLIMDSNFSIYLIKHSDMERLEIFTKMQIIIKTEMCLVGELILKNLVTVPDDLVMSNQSHEIYTYYYENFGDSLAMRLSPVDLIRKRSKGINSQENKSRLSEAKPIVSSKKPHKNQPQRTRPRTSKCGILERMLSPNTKIVYPDSMSIFTNSLHQKLKKISQKTYLYQEDYDYDLNNSISTHTLEIVFEGIRVKAYNNDEEETWKGKRAPVMPYHESQYYRTSIAYHTSHIAHHKLSCSSRLHNQYLSASFSLFTHL